MLLVSQHERTQSRISKEISRLRNKLKVEDNAKDRGYLKDLEDKRTIDEAQYAFTISEFDDSIRAIKKDMRDMHNMGDMSGPKEGHIPPLLGS